MPIGIYGTFVNSQIILSKHISILGCGWLGLPLAIKLRAYNFKVLGSTTSEGKLNILKTNGIESFLIDLRLTTLQPNSLFLQTDVLVINIPPQLRTQTEEQYLNQMEGLAAAVAQSAVKRVLFVSSTSVYDELCADITETDVVNPNSAMHRAEQIFVSNTNFDTIVIRFAGLIGPGRNPARFFAGKTDVPNGLASVNLIHLDDCIGIIESILVSSSMATGFYHAAAPTHPAKDEFYTAAAKLASLPPPMFKSELLEWKTINPVKLQSALGYRFKYPDILACLNSINA